MKLIKSLGIAGLVIGSFAFSVFAGENCSSVAAKAACKAKAATVSTVSNSKDGASCSAKTASVKTVQNAKTCTKAEKAACASKVAEVEVNSDNALETVAKTVTNTAKTAKAKIRTN
ncbi:MAG: hypothetical protein DWQ06_01030 [Calditrichaeota bacterium]|nr:MAG: hypothetical protein DWQ06_01030 [Calditrichota bacterium]